MSQRSKQLERDAAFLLNSTRSTITISPQAPKELESLLGVDLPKDKKINVAKGDEEFAFVVCQVVDLDHPIYFSDNIITQCSVCECDIQHRPYAPTKPPKICISCAAQQVREQEEKDNG